MKEKNDIKTIPEIFGENVFSMKIMRKYISGEAYKSLTSTIYQGKTLDPEIADEVAEAMKTWALEKGASHYSHWFQPLTGTTAEKHDSFLVTNSEGEAICSFSGKDLIRGESDASSFPSGGLRATFEARGYTAWDPSSPAFIKQSKNGATLCIPTVFWSYHGEALDKKTPLLRSILALTEQITRLAKLLKIKSTGHHPFVAVGPEQEYFLIDKKYYAQRPDLAQTGRTLFGRKPPKHQQMEDHYFGSIKSRVLIFMNELDRELWRLGVPAKTRHNEVCPGQFEIAPIFENANLAVDHNMLIMEALREISERHGFACLLHEKPFAGMNGSGKHNNWSVYGPDGKNWIAPGDNILDNIRFVTLICAIIKAVDTYAGLLRAAVASAGNDRRLGGHEAPPPIISIFLGDQLSEAITEFGGRKNGQDNFLIQTEKKKPGGLFIKINSTVFPSFPRDTTDRNRTAPLAFTGNKFEFRAVGSSQSCAGANVVLNTIVAEAIDEICSRLEADTARGEELNKSLEKTLKDIISKHGRVLFDGDCYSEAWRKEAAKRGLPNISNTSEALKELNKERTIAMFEKYNVLSSRELRSRYEIYQRAYDQAIGIEAECAASMVHTLIIPAALSYQHELADTIRSLQAAGKTQTIETEKLLLKINKTTDKMLKDITKLETKIRKGDVIEMSMAADTLRQSVDELEGLLPKNLWPIPSYAEMMFIS